MRQVQVATFIYIRPRLLDGIFFSVLSILDLNPPGPGRRRRGVYNPPPAVPSGAAQARGPGTVHYPAGTRGDSDDIMSSSPLTVVFRVTELRSYNSSPGPPAAPAGGPDSGRGSSPSHCRSVTPARAVTPRDSAEPDLKLGQPRTPANSCLSAWPGPRRDRRAPGRAGPGPRATTGPGRLYYAACH